MLVLYHTKKKDNREKYKIVNLIIYDESSSYERKMKLELEKLNRVHNHFVKQIFVCFNNSIQNTMEVRGNILYMKGKETFIPGILDKTVKGMSYCYDKYDFDYLVRSNISTVIDFKRVPFEEIPLDNMAYASSKVITLIKIKPKEDKSMIGLQFASGTNIIMNKRTVHYLLTNMNKLDRTIIDDVSIALLMRKITIPIELKTKLIFNKIDNKGVMFRNKNKKQREEDVQRIKKIVDMLLTR